MHRNVKRQLNWQSQAALQHHFSSLLNPLQTINEIVVIYVRGVCEHT